MTHERREEYAGDAVRTLRTPDPDREFRDRLRREFAGGTIRGTLPEAARGPGRPSARVVPIVFAFATAATILVAVALERSSRAHPWIEGGLADDRARTHAAGERITTGPEEMRDLRCDNWATFQLAPSTRIELPSSPGRWLAKTSTGIVHAGELRVVTGPSFPGTTLRLVVPHAMIEVTGTTLAVIAGADSSCLCVLEGSARITGRSGDARSVLGGRRVTLYGDGRTPFEEGILPMERMKLEMLRDSSWDAPPERAK